MTGPSAYYTVMARATKMVIFVLNVPIIYEPFFNAKYDYIVIFLPFSCQKMF